MTLNFSLADFDTGVFPDSYASARQYWLALLEKTRPARLHAPFSCGGQGPEGEALVTDTVWLGDEQAGSVLVVIAGTHGVEGFAGSAVQTDLLRQLNAGHLRLPEGTALLLIHALTPWGYAWLRRCGEEGVDLNRNAVDFTQPLPENLGYRELQPVLYAEDAASRQQTLADFSLRHGREALEKALSGGQYHDRRGPFYGGRAPAHGRLVCEELIKRHELEKRRLAVIDVHTGLGAYGYGEIICDHRPDSPGAATARNWYGDSVTLPLAGTSSSVPKLGLMDYLWHGVMNPRSCFVTLEFGTYSTDKLFETLLLDHQIWAKQGNIEARQAHSQIMRRHFYPDDPAWREMLLFRARQVIAQAIHGLSE